MNIKELIKQPEGGGLSLKASCRRMQTWQRPLWLLQMMPVESYISVSEIIPVK